MFVMARVFSIIAILIYFIWGQGFAYGWVVCIPLYILIGLVLSGKVQILQWLISIYLLGVTLFASPTFGYSAQERAQYNSGYNDGNFGFTMGGIGDSPDDWWEGHKDKASIDISKYKKYYIYGFKRGLDNKNR